MALTSKNKVSSSFSMSSMTDIVFLLLIFFMLTSTLVAPNAFKLSLPISDMQTKATTPIVNICIRDAGQNAYEYAINTTFIPFNSLERKLREAIGNEKDPTVSLHCDRSVPMEEVIKIMGIAKRNKYRLILATQRK